MVEVTIVASESEFSKEEEARLQSLADTWIAEKDYSVREIMHCLGIKENLSVSMYGDGEQGITLKCHKPAIAPKVATA